jgi:hypothetical protein
MLTITPDLDRLTGPGSGQLAAQRGGDLLPAAVERPVRAVDVVEPDDAGLHPELIGVVLAEPLADQLLPAIGVLGVGRVGVLLLQGGHVRVRLQVLGVDAGRGAVEVAGHALQPGRLDGVDVDEGVVAQDGGVVGGDEAHAAHVRGQRVHLVDVPGGQQALVPPAQVPQLELVGVHVGVLGTLEVDTPDPVAALLQIGDEVVADEPPGSGHQHPPVSVFAHSISHAVQVAIGSVLACLEGAVL